MLTAGETSPEYALRNPFVFHGQTLTAKPTSSCLGHTYVDPPVRQPGSSRRADPHRPQPAAPRPGGGEAVLIGRAGGPAERRCGPMAETGGLTARCLRAARRLLPAGVRRESGELARLAGPVVRAGDAGTGAARGAGGPERSFPRRFPRSRRCSEALRCRLHPPAGTDGARPESNRCGSSFSCHPARQIPFQPSPSPGSALGARALLLAWAENPSNWMLCVLSPPPLLVDEDQVEQLWAMSSLTLTWPQCRGAAEEVTVVSVPVAVPISPSTLPSPAWWAQRTSKQSWC